MARTFNVFRLLPYVLITIALVAALGYSLLSGNVFSNSSPTATVPGTVVVDSSSEATAYPLEVSPATPMDLQNPTPASSKIYRIFRGMQGLNSDNCGVSGTSFTVTLTFAEGSTYELGTIVREETLSFKATAVEGGVTLWYLNKVDTPPISLKVGEKGVVNRDYTNKEGITYKFPYIILFIVKSADPTTLQFCLAPPSNEDLHPYPSG